MNSNVNYSKLITVKQETNVLEHLPKENLIYYKSDVYFYSWKKATTIISASEYV